MLDRLSGQCCDHIGATRVLIKKLLAEKKLEAFGIWKPLLVTIMPLFKKTVPRCRKQKPHSSFKHCHNVLPWSYGIMMASWWHHDRSSMLDSLFRSRTRPWIAIHALSSVLCLANSSWELSEMVKSWMSWCAMLWKDVGWHYADYAPKTSKNIQNLDKWEWVNVDYSI